jgi:hypothetical protein
MWGTTLIIKIPSVASLRHCPTSPESVPHFTGIRKRLSQKCVCESGRVFEAACYRADQQRCPAPRYQEAGYDGCGVALGDPISSRLDVMNVSLHEPTRSASRSRSLCAEAGKRAAPLSPHPFLCQQYPAFFAPDRFRLTIPIRIGNIEEPASLRSDA